MLEAFNKHQNIEFKFKKIIYILFKLKLKK